MLTTKQIEELISKVLAIGTLLSASLVAVGGVWYLYQAGQLPAVSEWHSNPTFNSVHVIWQALLNFQPLGLIGLGVICLIATQAIRVGLLVWFYTSSGDYWFSAFSIFIFIVLIYSFTFHPS